MVDVVSLKFPKEVPVFKFALREDLVDTGDLFLPKQGTDRSTGYDVRAAFQDRKPLNIRPGKYVKIPLGFRVFCPEGWWLKLSPRSSSFSKKHLHCLYGIVDEDFQGQMLMICQYLPDISTLGNDLVIEFGEAIGQIIPVKRESMQVIQVNNQEYDDECKKRNGQRGSGGFGSTDRK